MQAAPAHHAPDVSETGQSLGAHCRSGFKVGQVMLDPSREITQLVACQMRQLIDRSE